MLKKLFSPVRINHLYALLHQLLMAAYGFALLFLMVRLMPQQEVGRWLLFVSALSISDMLMQGLLQTIVVKESAACKNDAGMMHQIQNNALLLSACVVACISIITVGIRFASDTFKHSVLFLTDFTTWYPALGLVMLIYNLSWWVNTGKSNFRTILIQRLIYCAVSLSIILADYVMHQSITFNTVLHMLLL